MAEKTGIEWADATWNPWRGCVEVSPGCSNCYAKTLAKRAPASLGVWGNQGTRVVGAPSYWKLPEKWNRKAGELPGDWYCPGCGDHLADSRVTPEECCDTCKTSCEFHRQPFTVFCASLADLFEDWSGPMTDTQGRPLWWSEDGGGWSPQMDGRFSVPLTMEHARRQVFNVIRETPNLTWLIVTKRAENIRKFWPQKWKRGDVTGQGGEVVANIPEFFPNVCLMVTAEDQGQLVNRWKHLNGTGDLSQWRGLSCEPLLAPLNLTHIASGDFRVPCVSNALTGENFWPDNDMDIQAALDWVIVGGESGSRARPMKPEWVKSIRDQCQQFDVPFFFKQWGEWLPSNHGDWNEIGRRSRFPKRSFPDTGQIMFRVGTAKAGRLFDGVEYSGRPDFWRNHNGQAT